MSNPYASPAAASVETDESRYTTPQLGTIVLVTIVAPAVCVWLGRVVCWIRGGWLSRQLEIPAVHWRLPHEFVLNSLLAVLHGVVIGVFTLLLVVPTLRRLGNWNAAYLAYGVSAAVVVAYELLKPYERIEVPTDALLVMVCVVASCVAAQVASRFVNR
ncbi:hypothetical protein Pla123a_17620 [Posidoniimonas polymericola]|uniref:Uncharacterized protein n=1 Tax=Posidoniimonas polymericola TaxID=2528002 RepID=A0A5C5YTA2_9BACT|nr:hypothetical protein [Posidoniimonas polymericola]TWT77963.1 hypothetical protein Pla123a_17620 [Posidoniimonas polymericola]